MCGTEDERLITIVLEFSQFSNLETQVNEIRFYILAYITEFI